MNRNVATYMQTGMASSHHLHRKLLPLLIAGCFGAAPALANPVGPQVISGQAGFSNQGNVLTVTNSPGAILNWQSFSIGANETTRFVQQDGASAVLNRIVGQDPSQIFGSLQSNGRVFLINPNGILFGQGAQINVNGLVASTLNISNEDFLAGRLKFQAGERAGSLQNQGSITTPSGGQVYLIAPNVENTGIVTSPKGEVVLAAGHSVHLVDSGNPDLHVVVSAPDNQALNLGQVIAEGGKIGIFAALISQRGMVSANSAVVGENGKIVFKASKDALLEAGSQTSATGAGSGGTIHVLGERVSVGGNAVIDASGRAGGGTVLVGGDFQGKNAAIQNARQVFFGRDAIVRADAIDQGDGGKVILWSDEMTRAYGTISAQGGKQSGNGGFVEVSGKQTLVFDADVYTSAANGKAGMLLLDPQDIIIQNGAGAIDDDRAFDGVVDGQDANDTTDVTISESRLESLYGSITLQASRDVIFNDLDDDQLNLVNVTSGSTFSITAGRDILSNGALARNDVVQTGGGAVTLLAAGKIDFGRIATNGGLVTMNAATTLDIGQINTSSGASAGGDINLTSGGLMRLGTSIIGGLNTSGSPAGSVLLNSGGPIHMINSHAIITNQLKMTAVGGINDGSPGPIDTQVNSLNARNSGSGDIFILNAGSSMSIDDIGAVGYGIQQVGGGQNIFVSTSGNLTVNAGISTANGGRIELAATNPGALITTTANAQINNFGGSIDLLADRMNLSGVINASGGFVKLAPYSASAIHVGTALTSDATPSALELTTAELNTVRAAKLIIGKSNSGAIDIKSALFGGPGGALEYVTTALGLESGGAITQQAGAIIAGGSAVGAIGADVNLMEANSTGVILGKASTGDFQYRSVNQITATTIDNHSGIVVSAGKTIRLVSDFFGINQALGSALIGGQLVLQAPGPVSLTDSANRIGKVAANLYAGGAGTGTFSLRNNGNLAVDGPFYGISGISTNNQNVSIAVLPGYTITLNQPINAGSGTVTLSTDGRFAPAPVVTVPGLLAKDPVLSNTVTTVSTNTLIATIASLAPQQSGDGQADSSTNDSEPTGSAQTTVNPIQGGVKKDDVGQKMYCN